MKVLIVNCVFGYGSTGKLMHSLHEGLLGRGLDSIMCFGRGAESELPNVFKLAPEWVMQTQSLISKLSGYVYGCSPISTFNLKKIVNRERPDIVNIHCGNANTFNVVGMLKFLKRRNIPTVISLHAEFLYTGGCGHALNCGKWLTGCGCCPQFKSSDSQLPESWFFDKTKQYWNGLKDAYTNFNNLRITCVSGWVKSRADQSPFFNPYLQVSVVHNGVNTTIYRPSDYSFLLNRYNLSRENKIFIHVTPDFKSELKGGRFIVDIAKRLHKEVPGARIFVVGAKTDPEDYPANMIFVPHTSNQTELAAYYSMADATILASKRETYSMVTAESLCCGTPVVGFKAGGPESICIKGHTLFCEYGDVDTLYNNCLSIKKEDNISEIYSPIFSDENMVNGYISVYQDLLNNLSK